MRIFISVVFFCLLTQVQAQSDQSNDQGVRIYEGRAIQPNTPTTYYDYTKKDLVHPNPSEGVFYLNSIEEGDDIKVFDGTGRMMYSQTGSTGKATINLTHLEKGIYRVLVRDRSKRLKINQKVLIK